MLDKIPRLKWIRVSLGAQFGTDGMAMINGVSSQMQARAQIVVHQNTDRVYNKSNPSGNLWRLEREYGLAYSIVVPTPCVLCIDKPRFGFVALLESSVHVSPSLRTISPRS